MFTAAAEQIYKVTAKNSVNIWQICQICSRRHHLILWHSWNKTYQRKRILLFYALELVIININMQNPTAVPCETSFGFFSEGSMIVWHSQWKRLSLCFYNENDQQSPHGACILWFIDVYVLMANLTKQLEPLIYAECFKQLKTASAHGWDSQRRFHEGKIIIFS